MLLSFSCSMGQFPRASPHSHGMVSRHFRKGPPPKVTRATGVEKRIEFEGNVGSLQVMHNKELKANTRKKLQGVELSLSLYDTAWVSMVSERGSPQAPCYPRCIEWILQNQQDNGSWGINPSSSSVDKDILLCTLACVVALKRWNVGPYHIKRGLNFIGRNFSVAMDVKTIAPAGFNITFSGLISLAAGMGLRLPVMQTYIDEIFHLRKIELERLAN
ncbi:hypothetical protein OsJ_36143 [Oryza sativa Japonica Group]|uniref:Uncharacterized protein n=1 Tax=Oryza sativa subsp. japonica TaxID=39947 RepID=B9GD81_ORYSJ|nr:hypothetical protein OsJ_36143 [Oryza sativa Japonica Group]